MGQEHSSSSKTGESSNSSLSFLQKAKGISSPKPNRANKITVVSHAPNSESTPDPKKDEDYLKLQSVPQFYPILKNNLNISGLKDPVDLYTKISHRSVLGFCHRLQEHFIVTSEIVAAEQGSLGTRIREIDYAITTLTNFLTERQKAYAKYAAEIHRIREINAQLKRLTASLEEMVPSVENLNEFLPEKDRLPPLNLGRFSEDEVNENFVPEGISEQKVVDKREISESCKKDDSNQASENQDTNSLVKNSS